MSGGCCATEISEKTFLHDKYPFSFFIRKKRLKSNTPYLNLSQTVLEKILLRKVADNPLIELLFQHQWQSLTQDEPTVKSELLNRQNNTITTLASQYLVAACLLYTSPSPRDQRGSRMPSSA